MSDPMEPHVELDPTWFLQSFTENANWGHIFVDLGIGLGALLVGMLFYVALHGNPCQVIDLDITDLDTKNPGHCYTEEEAIAKYGPNEGHEFGDEFQLCGSRLPKERAVKFAVLSGSKVADVFRKLSYEEKFALMNGMARLPEDLMDESLRDYYKGSDMKKCDGCKAAPGQGGCSLEACPRCLYTACEQCLPDYKLGRCYCRLSNFGVDYPPPSKRAFHQTGMW